MKPMKNQKVNLHWSLLLPLLPPSNSQSKTAFSELNCHLACPRNYRVWRACGSLAMSHYLRERWRYTWVLFTSQAHATLSTVYSSPLSHSPSLSLSVPFYSPVSISFCRAALAKLAKENVVYASQALNVMENQVIWLLLELLFLIAFICFISRTKLHL